MLFANPSGRPIIRTVVVRISRKLSATYRLRSGKFCSQLLLTLVAAVAPGVAQALPSGMNTVSGGVTSTTTGSSMTLNQSTPKAILDWNSFSIGKGEAVRFVQPGASSVALNRVVGGDLSSIYGTLGANGQVFLLNPAGVFFAPGAQINVGGLVATTLGLSNNDFLAGHYAFTGSSGAPVINQGTLSGGYIVLAGANVSNAGTIITRGGSTGLLAGSRVSVDPAGDGLVKFSVDARALSAAVANSGTINADGGQVAARSIADTLSTVINQSGVIRANTISNQNGTIVLSGGPTGIVQNFGTLEARGANAGETGGTVKVLGDRIALASSSSIDVSGDAGGGTVLVGGNWQGKGPEQNAFATTMSAGAQVHADAISAGAGGKVVLWADGTTKFGGVITARGGALSGNGGRVETSGKQLAVARSTSVDTSAAHGATGNWLLDPVDVVVKTIGANATVTDVDQFSDASAPEPATIDPVAQINPSATTVTLQAKHDVTFTDAVNMANAGAGLTAQAGNNITVNAGITTNNGAITLSANDPASGAATGTGTIAVNAALKSKGANIALTNNGSTGTLGIAAAIDARAGAVNLSSGGAITESGSGAIGITGTLTTTSVGGTTLDGAFNGVAGFSATNSGSGDIHLQNSAPTLTITRLSQSGGGSVLVNNVGAIAITGAVGASSGNVTLNSSGAITESGAGAIATTGTLQTWSLAGTMLHGANTVSTFGANNIGAGFVPATTTGNIELTNSGPLTIAGIRNSGPITVNNAGPIQLTGVIGTWDGPQRAAPITLNASGTIGASGSGLVDTWGLLTTSSSGGTALQNTNTVGSYNATNSGGDVSFANWNRGGILTVTGVSESGTGSVRVSNTGALGTTGAITTANGSITLVGATANLGAPVAAGGAGGVALTAQDGTLAMQAAADITAGNEVNLVGKGGIETAGDVTATDAAVKYSGGVTLTGPVAISTGAGWVGVGGWITGAGQDLALASGAGVAVTGAISGIGRLTTGAGTNLTVAGLDAATAALGGAVTAVPGTQRYAGDVTLTHDVTLAGGGVTFGGNVSGPYALAVNTIGGTSTNFNGAVNVASLATNADGTKQVNGGGVTTTGSQSWGGPVNLGVRPATFTGANVTFGAVAGAQPMTVNTTGNGITTFRGPVTVESLTTNADGTTQVRGGWITTTGAQTFNDDVQVADSRQTFTGAGVTFTRTLTGDAQVFVNTTGSTDTTFNGNVRVAWLQTNADGTTRIGAKVNTSGPLAFHDNVTLTTDTTLFAGAEIVFEGTVVGDHALSLDHGSYYGNTSFYKPVDIGSLMTWNGTTWILGGGVTTTGAQTYRGAVRIGGSPAVLSGAGLTFNGEVTGPQPLVVNTIAGTATTFNKPVSVQSLTTGVDGTTNVNGGSIQTTGAQTYGNAVVLGGYPTPPEYGENVTFAGSSVTFNGTVSGQQSLNVNTTGSGTKTFGGPVDVYSLVTNADGTTRIGADITTRGPQQEYKDNVTLTKDVTISAVDVRFRGAVSGNQALTVNNLYTCDAYGSCYTNLATFEKPVNIGSLTSNKRGTQIWGGSLTTTGAQTYNSELFMWTAEKNSTLTGAGVTFGGAIHGNTLAVNTTGGKPIVFKGTVLLGDTWTAGSLTTNGDGVTDLNGGSVKTYGPGPQTYNNNVVLSADAILDGAVTFNGTVTKGPYTLTLTGPSGAPATSSTAATSLKSVAPLFRP